MILFDGDEGFEVTRIDPPAAARRVVLFSVGGGGNPGRHDGLMKRLAADGAIVVAPHFERLNPPEVPVGALEMRARRLKLALDVRGTSGLPVMGVGHSIGAVMLLALTGGHMWAPTGQRIAVEPEPRLQRIVMLTPPTTFFRAPHALDDVKVPIMAWAGTADDITPPEQIEFLRDTLNPSVPFEMRITEGAGHFSFLDQPPPKIPEPLADQPAFVAKLADEICRYFAA